MDTFPPYFEYEMMCGCGIPAITPTGAPDDWRDIRRRATHFASYGLEDWISALLPVLDQIEATSRGHRNPEFWNSFFRYESGSGGSEMTGWIQVLFPYLNDDYPNKKLVPNPYVKSWHSISAARGEAGAAIANSRRPSYDNRTWISSASGPILEGQTVSRNPSTVASATTVLIAVLCVCRSHAATYTFTILDDPAAVPGNTTAYGISGNTVVGTFFDSSSQYHGFSETGGVYSTLTAPGANSLTYALGISGNTIVGYYWDSRDTSHGFSETGGVYTSLSDPLAIVPPPVSEGFGTIASGVSGNTVVGSYTTNSIGFNHGFSETGGVYTPVDDPAAAGGFGTNANGISGNTVVGQYWDSAGIIHGFSETGGVYSSLDDPSATSETIANGLSGNTIVGTFYGSSNLAQGFVETGGVYQTVDVPGATQTYINGIDGNTITGYYIDSGDLFHGFTATAAAPLPSSAAMLIVLAALALAFFCRRQWNQRRGWTGSLSSPPTSLRLRGSA